MEILKELPSSGAYKNKQMDVSMTYNFKKSHISESKTIREYAAQQNIKLSNRQTKSKAPLHNFHDQSEEVLERFCLVERNWQEETNLSELYLCPLSVLCLSDP